MSPVESLPFDVPIKTWLPADVYRTFEQLARQRDTTVAVLVAVAARKAVTPRSAQSSTSRTRSTYRSLSHDPARFALFRDLLKTDLTMKQIADRLDVSLSTVYNHLHRARSHQ